MKGQVFGKWLQEFCSLVFVQTIQAFVLAIIMTIVVTAMSNGATGDNSLGNTDVLYSTGILAIIALTSISKIELLVKQIFGLNGGLGDKANMKEGRGGLLGGLFALQMAKKAVDNVPKIASGLYGSSQTKRDLKQEKMNLVDKLNKLDNRYGVNGANNTANAANGATTAGTATGGTTTTAGGAAGAGGAGGAAGAAGAAGTANAGNGATTAGAAQPSNTSSSSSNLSTKDRISYEEKRDKLIEEYNKKEAELKKQLKENRKKSLSGFTESVFGIGGATAAMIGKGVVGGATGDLTLQDVAKAAGTGLGIGDTIGKGVVNGPVAINDFAKEVRNIRKANSEYKTRKSEVEKLISDLKNNVNAGNYD